MLAAVTGARHAQLLGLRWHNVRAESRRVSFCAGWVEGPDGPVLAATKTRRSDAVDLDRDSFAVLEQLRHTVPPWCPADGFVFSSDGGATA